MKYKFLPHTADLKFRAYGKTIEEAFINAGYAIKSIISKKKVKQFIKKSIKIQGNDIENLMGALGQLRKLYTLQFWLFMISLIFVAIGLILIVIFGVAANIG